MKFRRLWCKVVIKLKYVSQKYFVKHYYEYYTGKKLNYDNPVEFNQKISWLKVFYQPPILNQLADKYAVRDYVSKKIGKEYLNECYHVFEKVSDIDYDILPEQFVIKGVHGAGFNLIVSNKNNLDREQANRQLKKWLNRNYYYRRGREWVYKNIKPRLIVEKYLNEFEKGSITDYKFYCFNGNPKFLEVHLDRINNHKSAFYDLDFKKLPFRDVPVDKWISHSVMKPFNFEEMKMIAKKLAGKLPFVRVDLYSIEGKIIFGEMTFYPADARDDFYPPKYNKIIGDYLKLPKPKSGEKVITTY